MTATGKIGFIGLGIMGKPMARNLMKANYQLIVYDINRAPVEELAKEGAALAASPREAASEATLVITMLPNSPHVREVLLGKNGVIHGAKPGTTVIDMSSIAPLVSREMEAALREKGVAMLDAPVSGGEPGAVAGTLSIMVGGDRELFQRYRDILGRMGKSVVHVGPIGSGNVAKLSNQIIVALNIAAVSEALLLAEKAGVSPRVVYEAIRGGLAGSNVLDAKAPMMIERRFAPGFKIDLHAKDLGNVLETSRQLNVPLPLTALAMEILQSLQASGLGSEDHSAIVKFYEKMAGIEVGEE
ncbi:MAG: 2-hydroxy-3-oxopropionate reductase [Firmicutes bacterium]|nr:2-hydroxy-3-oxopropionate reductase [Bacillota bacterium]